MDKAANSPVRQGMKEASGTIAADVMGGAVAMKFSFKAPNIVQVSIDAAPEDPVAAMRKRLAAGAERTLRRALGVVHPADDEEFDADVAKKDGADVLALTFF